MRRLLPTSNLPASSALMFVCILSGCTSSSSTFYHQEDFRETDTFSRSYAESDAQVCEAARRALLGQGYVISNAQHDIVDGTKSFQPKNDEHVEIAFHIVCVANGNPDRRTSLFVSATQDRFALKKTNNSASVGVGVLGSVSMPFSSSDDSLVRIASETIVSAPFYNGFFQAVDRYVGSGPNDDADTPGASSFDHPVVIPKKKEPR